MNMKQIYFSSEKTGAPLSGAAESNGLIFLSGQIHLGPSGKLEGNTIEEKFAIVMGNISKILAEAGLTLADVIRVQIYLTNLGELPSLNKVYPTYFSHPFPVRTAIGVSALPLGASLEIDVIASRK